jgi:hypothetical protein
MGTSHNTSQDWLPNFWSHWLSEGSMGQSRWTMAAPAPTYMLVTAYKRWTLEVLRINQNYSSLKRISLKSMQSQSTWLQKQLLGCHYQKKIRHSRTFACINWAHPCLEKALWESLIYLSRSLLATMHSALLIVSSPNSNQYRSYRFLSHRITEWTSHAI